VIESFVAFRRDYIIRLAQCQFCVLRAASSVARRHVDQQPLSLRMRLRQTAVNELKAEICHLRGRPI